MEAVIFKCHDCPKHTGDRGEFDNLNEALEHLQKYPNHILYLWRKEDKDDRTT